MRKICHEGAALQQQTAAVLGLAILLHYGYLSFPGGHFQCLTSLVAETLASETWPVEVGRLDRNHNPFGGPTGFRLEVVLRC